MVRAADGYVRVIVRRPHAYFFVEDLFADRGGIRSATPTGCALADGTSAPLPGLYVLDARGEHVQSIELLGADAASVAAALSR